MVILSTTATTKKMVVDTIEDYLSENPSGNAVTVGTTTPSAPKTGDIWFDTTE